MQAAAMNQSAMNPTASTSYSSALAASMAQQQTHPSQSKQNQMPMPSAADLNLLLSLGLGNLDASQLANLDLQKLAMYLVSIFHQSNKKEIKISTQNQML